MKTNNTKKYLLFLILLIFILAGCNKTNSTVIPDDISDSLLVTYQTGPEISTIGYVETIIDNTSKYCIVFPPDYGVKIYKDVNGEIKGIRNGTIYLGDQSRYLNPIGDIRSRIYVSFSPDFSNQIITQKTNYFAEVTGHLCDDESVIITKKILFVVVP